MDAQKRTARLSAGLRIGMIALYVFLTLPVIILVAVQVEALRWLFVVDMTVRAVPLWLTCWVDRTFHDGGELSPELLPLWVGLTAVLLWPLALLGVFPTLWASRPWRRVILGYSALALVATIAAARWVFTHTGTFF